RKAQSPRETLADIFGKLSRAHGRFLVHQDSILSQRIKTKCRQHQHRGDDQDSLIKERVFVSSSFHPSDSRRCSKASGDLSWFCKTRWICNRFHKSSLAVGTIGNKLG